MTDYQDSEGFAHSFQRSELAVGKSIYIAIVNVEGDQPTEEGVVKGTTPYPIARTPGTMGLGEGTITFSSEAERQRFLDDRAAEADGAWREAIFPMTWTRNAPGKPAIKTVYYECRVLSEPLADEEGPDPLGGDITFSFMNFSRNGKMPHRGKTAPSQ